MHWTLANKAFVKHALHSSIFFFVVGGIQAALWQQQSVELNASEILFGKNFMRLKNYINLLTYESVGGV